MTSLVVGTSPFALTLIACFVAGILAGDPGYPRRIRQPPGGPEQRGREVTIALAGTPIAIALGTPTGAPSRSLLLAAQENRKRSASAWRAPRVDRPTT